MPENLRAMRPKFVHPKYYEIYLKKLNHDRKEIHTVSDNKKVIVFSLYSSWLPHIQVDSVVASALQLRGCEVLVIGCDGVYHDCYVTRDFNSIQTVSCQDCAQIGKTFFEKLFNLPYMQLRNFTASDDYEVANKWIETIKPEDYANTVYNNLPIGQWVTSSIYTYFRISARGLSRPNIMRVHRQYLVDGLVTYFAVLRLFTTHKPTNLFLFNGRFAPYRIAFEVARKLNIDVITHERGWIDDSFIFYDNCVTWSTKPPLDCVSTWEGVALTNQELLQTKQYFTQRESGREMNWPAYYNFKTDYADVRHQLRIPLDAKIFSVFTSSEDELAALQDWNKITEQFDIIERLIEIFRNREEYLVIRHHPFIGGTKAQPVETDSLSKAYDQLLSAPKNVRIVMPSEQLTSYALLWHTDAAIAFFSTVAIESIARGVPTATLVTSSYEKASRYVIRENTIEHLNQLVDSLFAESAKPNKEDYTRLYRFTNAYFFKFCQKFKSFGIKNFHLHDLRFQTLDDLQPGIDPTLDRVCNRILFGYPLENLPSESHSNRDAEQEDTFYKQQLEEVQSYKMSIREETLKNQNQGLSASPSVGVINLKYKGVPEKSQLLHDWIQQSRYENVVVHECKEFHLEDYQNIVDLILDKLEILPEDYILVTNDYIQYDESFLSSAMDILTSNDFQGIDGICVAAWLSSLEKNIEDGIFIQGMFNKAGNFILRDAAISYQQAIELFPLFQYPPTILALSLIRKKALIEILKAVRNLPTMNLAAEDLFNYVVNGLNIHKIESPKLVIRQESEIFQTLWKRHLALNMVEELSQHVPYIAPVGEGIHRPFWSVMIPAYNRVDYLVETLKCVLAQDPGSEKMQIAVIDDCSTEDLETVVKEIGKGRVEYFRHSQNVGATPTFNTCLQKARGHWIHLLNSDDIVLEGFYRRWQTAIRKEPTIGAAFCRYVFVDENGHWTNIISPVERETPGILENYIERIGIINRIMSPSIVVKRSVYESLGGYRPELPYSADWDMWKRITLNYPVWFEPQPLACYRQHSISFTSSLSRSGGDITEACIAIDIAQSYLPPAITIELSNLARDAHAAKAIDTAYRMIAKGDKSSAIAQIRAGLKCSHSPRVMGSLVNLIQQMAINSTEFNLLPFTALDQFLAQFQSLSSLSQEVEHYQKEPTNKSVLDNLRHSRKEVAEKWLSLPAEQLGEMYLGDFGKTHKILVNSGIQSELLTDFEQNFVDEILENLSQQFAQRKAMNYLLAAMLYLPTDRLPLPSNQSQIPNWFLSDYVELARQQRLDLDSLKLKNINFIVFPDWSQPEESLGAELANLLRAIATHPDRSQMTLLIGTSNIADEEAEMLLSDVTMHLIMEEDLEIDEETTISLVGKLTEIQWEALLPSLDARIVLENENQQAIAQAKVKKIPSCQIDNLLDKRVAQLKTGDWSLQ